MVEKERKKKEEKKKREIRGPWNGIVEAFRNFRGGIPFGLVYELRNGPCAHRAPLRDYTTRLHDEINTCTRVSARACVDAHQYSRVMFQEITSNAIFYSFRRLYTPLSSCRHDHQEKVHPLLLDGLSQYISMSFSPEATK